MDPKGIYCVAPSSLGIGELFSLRIKVLGNVRKIECSGNYCDRKPGLNGPFNLNVSRQIQYHDNCLPEWSGELEIDAGPWLRGLRRIFFDGHRQGVFPGDSRPIMEVGGFSIESPGFHFIRVIDKASGVECVSNPIWVACHPPDNRIFWGDPHWQTYFSDGIRCPEELYSFARNEGFLDFGAISDHMEAITDRQWEYFQAVTNDYCEPGRFVTLIGQEWTNHAQVSGAPGHRNIYYRGNGGPALRSNDPDCDTLPKLWAKLDNLDAIEAIAIPHHSANALMGVDWKQGWNRKYEKAVEIHSVWGSSERHSDAGNPMPIRNCQGEVKGRHVVDALNLGYRFGFVGGGDIHDGRPGDQLHTESYPPSYGGFWSQGFTAVRVPSLSRDSVFNAIRDKKTYATTGSRIYLDTLVRQEGNKHDILINAASEEGIAKVEIVINGRDILDLHPDGNRRTITTKRVPLPPLEPGDFCYARLSTSKGDMAWSSPVWA